MNAQPKDTGAIVASLECCSLTTKKAEAILAGMKQYLAEMNRLGKRPSAIRLRADQFSTLIREAKSKVEGAPDVCGLKFYGFDVLPIGPLQ